ncbi:hypothetical protein PPROV_000179300 [Pycnococcus provasolii]|uniref:Uncharacterized protein n=1 Tax=Pycnococcus provasolii TaxID=41880 RepID=A0A830H8M1_9CHLO|nr:hypothetical protein PPROV_000179300 [Pycnococcus provasolii]
MDDYAHVEELEDLPDDLPEEEEIHDGEVIKASTANATSAAASTSKAEPAPVAKPKAAPKAKAAPAEKPAAEKKPTEAKAAPAEKKPEATPKAVAAASTSKAEPAPVAKPAAAAPEAEAAPAEKPAAEAKPGAAAPEEKATATATAKPAQAARTPAPAPEPEIDQASQQRPARVETVQDVANSRRTPEGIPTNGGATATGLKGALKLAQADAVRAIDLLREVEAERDWLLAQLEAREDQNAKLCEDVEMLHVMLEDALTPPMTTDGSTQTKHKAPYERDLSADFDPVATSSYVDVREGVALTEEQAMAIREADPTRPVARVLKNGTSAEQAYFNEMFKLRRALASQGNRLVPHQRYETYKGFGYSGRGARTSWGHNPSKPAPP